MLIIYLECKYSQVNLQRERDKQKNKIEIRKERFLE